VNLPLRGSNLDHGIAILGVGEKSSHRSVLSRCKYVFPLRESY
jgi:hypothetical protein